MTEISKGVYYNYYNVKGRYSPATPQQTAVQKRYTKVEDRIEGNNHNPEDEFYQATEKLNDMYYEASVRNRAMYKDVDSLRRALAQKYLSRNSYPGYNYTERRAMYENELNMTMFGNCKNVNDPRLNGPVMGATDEERTAYNRKSVNEQINGILSSSGINVSLLTNMSFSIDAYSHSLTVLGVEDSAVATSIEALLNADGNSKELFFHIMQSNYFNIDSDVKAKYHIIQDFKNMTGLDIRTFTQRDGGFFDAAGRNALDLYEEGLKITDRVPSQFKGVDYDVFKSNLGKFAGKNFATIPELNMQIGFRNGAIDDSTFNPAVVKGLDILV